MIISDKDGSNSFLLLSCVNRTENAISSLVYWEKGLIKKEIVKIKWWVIKKIKLWSAKLKYIEITETFSIYNKNKK